MALASSGSLFAFEKKYPPMLEEYRNYKKEYPDHYLFFQVGDFYELFFSDAEEVSKILNLTLTSRDKKDPNPIPMCGVPISAVEGYLERLLDAGYSAAFVSQVSADVTGIQKKGTPVERKLERIVTPGMRLMALGDSPQSVNARILALGLAGEGQKATVSLAWGDPGSGQIFVREDVPLGQIVEAVVQLDPAEVLLPKELSTYQGAASSGLSRRLSVIKDLERRLPSNCLRFRRLFNSTSDSLNAKNVSNDPKRLKSLSEYSLLGIGGRGAISLLIQFIDETTVASELPIHSINLYKNDTEMAIDSMTRRNLDLTETAREGSFSGSLLHFLGPTATTGGARLLRNWILSPLLDRNLILARQDLVQVLLSNFEERSLLTTVLRQIPDLERLAARADLNVITPRELAALRDGLTSILELVGILGLVSKNSSTERLESIFKELSVKLPILDTLQNALELTPPIQATDGGIVKKGYDQEVDRLISMVLEADRYQQNFQEQEKERTKIASLKVRFNSAIGLFIEVPKSQQQKVPDNYIHRQTLTNGARFSTKELRELEKQLTTAKQSLLEAELNIFKQLKLEVKQITATLRSLHSAVSELDVFCCLAKRAEDESFTRPKIIDSQSVLEVKDGWHPVLKTLIRERCIANDLQLNQDRRCLILTGPNMGGKSTYLRQAGLFVILAQMGSFVPAASMEFSIFNRVFARLGASDDLHQGDSTFMLEMKEAAMIAANATKDSLVLIDEIGRGTATTDGLSIAQAILEWIAQKLECCCLFATHYHQLTALSELYSSIANISVKVEEVDREVIFTHQVIDGAASRSYGVEVAKLAGLPEALIYRAKELLKENENHELSTSKSLEQLSIFQPEQVSSRVEDELLADHSELINEIYAVVKDKHPDDLTAREALRVYFDIYDAIQKYSKI